MTPRISLLLGIVLALALVGLARRYRPGKERRFYAIGMVIAPLIYVGFAVVGRASTQWLALEILGVFLFGAAAWGGLRGRPWLLALGWAAHVVWDVALHLSGAASEYTPGWYPWICVSFDLVMAAAVLASTRRESAG